MLFKSQSSLHIDKNALSRWQGQMPCAASLWLPGCPVSRRTPAGHDNPIMLELAVFGSFISYIYSAPPLKLKQSGWVGNYALGSSYIALPWWAGQVGLSECGSREALHQYCCPAVRGRWAAGCPFVGSGYFCRVASQPEWLGGQLLAWLALPSGVGCWEVQHSSNADFMPVAGPCECLTCHDLCCGG